jgi:hypothetical protein
MIKKLLIVAGFISCGTVVHAGEQENITACIEAVKIKSGKTVDEFNVLYNGNIVNFSEAEWPGIRCEVKFGTVYNLSVDGKVLIVDAWPSPERKHAFEEIERKVDDSVAVLENRIRILEARRDTAKTDLMEEKVTPESALRTIDATIVRALGE